MARQLKVFYGTAYKRGLILKCILATTTKKKACEILDVSMGELNNYWYCWTIDGCGRKDIKDQAFAQPDTPLYCLDREALKAATPTYKKIEEMV